MTAQGPDGNGNARRTTGRRKYLGKTVGLGTRLKVYSIPEGIEIDEQDVNEIVRRRVFFDDVLLVTYHRFFGWGFLLVTGLAGAFFTVLAWAVGSAESLAGYILLIWVAGPFWLAFALRLIFRVDAVTVFGKRTKAVMRFSFRKRRAREVFDLVCQRTREKQARPAGPEGSISRASIASHLAEQGNAGGE